MKNSAFVLLLTCLLVSCGPEKYMKRGNEASAIGEWQKASLEYAKAYAKTPSTEREKRGVIAYKMADANRKFGYVAKALASYRNAARYKFTDSLTYLQMADMEMQSRDYKNALAHYEDFLKQNPGNADALRGIQSAVAAPNLRQQGSHYTVREEKFLNSHYADYSPVIFDDKIFLSSTRKESQGEDISGITGMKSGDLFVCTKDAKGKWGRPEAIEGGVNTNFDEGSCAFGADGTMYFTRCTWDANYPRMAEIMASPRSDASWGEAKRCELLSDTLSVYAHPAPSPDGRYLYFVSNMPGGEGGLDIWRSEITPMGFGLMENLGPEINTPGDEMFPSFRPNGDLYFSSNGRVGMGGLDIYKATSDSLMRKDGTLEGHWFVEHLPSPVNSNGDDFGMTFDGIHNRGYFSSNRTNRRGWDKIYSFECPEIELSVVGWVYEQDGYELPQAQVFMVGDDGTNEKVNLKLDGSFEVEVKPNVKYAFMATCPGYMNANQTYSIAPQAESHSDTLQFPLPSVKVPVLVHNVFYEFNKANLLPQSFPALDDLVKLLKQNPQIAIELSAHCDYRGSQAYNQPLSQRRAESVVKYLTEHGIPNQRVIARGYGKMKPKVITPKFAELYPFLHAGDTLTEAFIRKLPKTQQDTCNALNRRTEFSVVDEKQIATPDSLAKAVGGIVTKPETISAPKANEPVKPQTPAPTQQKEKQPAETTLKRVVSPAEQREIARHRTDSILHNKKRNRLMGIKTADEEMKKPTPKITLSNKIKRQK